MRSSCSNDSASSPARPYSARVCRWITIVYGVLKVLEERGRTGAATSSMGSALPNSLCRAPSTVSERPASPVRCHAPGRRAGADRPGLTDPAQPYGAALAWPETQGARRGRVVARGPAAGEPLVWFDRRGHHLVTFPATLGRHVVGGGPRRW